MSEADRRKWDERYRQPQLTPATVSEFLIRVADELPAHGRALDVGGGMGQNAVWLAQRGLDVTLVDVSEVALERTRAAANVAGVPITTVRLDLEDDPLPPGPWDLIMATYYLWRPLFDAVTKLLAPGGVLVCVHPTRTNLQRHAKPGPEYLLDGGELPRLVHGLECVHYEENWSPDDRHEARMLARRFSVRPERADGN